MSPENQPWPPLAHDVRHNQADQAPFKFDPYANRFVEPAFEKQPALTSKSMAVSPDGSMYVRWFPNESMRDKPYAESDVETLLDVTTRHWKFLEEQGITVLNHQRVIGQAPRSDAVVLYTITPAQHGLTAFEYDNLEHEAIISNALAPALLSYFEWIVSTHQSHFLYDLPYVTQFYMQEGSTLEDPRLILIDLDPYAAALNTPTDTERKGYSQLLIAVENLEDMLQPETSSYTRWLHLLQLVDDLQ